MAISNQIQWPFLTVELFCVYIHTYIRTCIHIVVDTNETRIVVCGVGSRYMDLQLHRLHLLLWFIIWELGVAIDFDQVNSIVFLDSHTIYLCYMGEQ